MAKHEQEYIDKAKKDYESWDWSDLRSEGFWHFVIYHRVLMIGVPTAVLGFGILAWLRDVPLVDVIAGRSPGFGFLVKAFLVTVGIMSLTTGMFAAHEWRIREGKKQQTFPDQPS